jgi:NAD(P)-dependent dehydrogenase (short-subunit alcohol dehydrogenase family)
MRRTKDSFPAADFHKLSVWNLHPGGSMRLKDKIAIVVGAGQSPGEGMGNGRATVLRFAQEGAKVLAVDNNLASAEETAAIARQDARERASGARQDARQSGGEVVAFEADVAKETSLAAMVEAARQRFGRIDVLHYNVGVSIAGGDAPLDQITEAAFDRIATINLRGAIMACKHVLPVMRAQRSGVITMISSVAAWEQYPNVVYKATKAGMIAFTQQVAIQNAEFGVRANVILPGLMDTPMAVDTRARATGKSRAEVAAGRDARVPLRHKMGTAWDVANAALFLASDEAGFITGVALPVDGGALVHIN